MAKKRKVLVVYYSLDGNTEFIAHTIANAVGATVLKLQPKKTLKCTGFLKYFIGGMQVIFKKKPELLPYEIKPEDFDILFIGTPVWASSFTPALNTFFSKTRLKDKIIALFCCCEGQNGNTFDNMKKHLDGNIITDEMEFVKVLEGDRSANESAAGKWAAEMMAISS